jgi:LCP family protein required for cell wall assembly
LQQQTNQQPPIKGGATKANTRPNPNVDPRKPQATYRVRPASSGGRNGGTPRDHLSDRTYARMQGDIRRQRIRMALFLLLGLLVAGGVAAYAFVVAPIKGLVDKVPAIIKTQVPDHIVSVNGSGPTPVPVIYPDWSSKEPFNILLLGLDFRPQEEDSRSDTMIVVHIDPAEKTAAMMSIPRDLWLEIPGHGEARVNASYQLGEHDSEGGGPTLAMSTIEQAFDLFIPYYAQVNFTGFERVVDALGGVTIDVQKPLVDNDYPLSNYGTTRIYIPSGLQHMDGRTALQYARSRHADSDIGRNSRQQQVLLALRQQGLNLNLLGKLGDLSAALTNTVQTNLQIDQIGSLAQLANEIDRNSIENLSVGQECVYETVLPSGADVLVPVWTCIKPKMKTLFANPRLAKEAARIMVQNGTNTGGTGTELSDTLTITDGLAVMEVAAAPNQGEHPVTTITDFSGGTKENTVKALAQALGISPDDVKRGNAQDAPHAKADNQPIDILVIAGDDRIKRNQ